MIYSVAKTCLLEAEFMIDLICTDYKHTYNKETIHIDVNILLQEAKTIFSDFGNESLKARSMKSLGILWFNRQLDSSDK